MIRNENDLHGNLETLTERIAPGQSVTGHRAMTGGSSATMTAFDLEAPDGTRETLILRRSGPANLAADPQAASHEFRLLRALHDRGLPVPRAIHVDESGTLIATPFLVICHLDGAPDYEPADPLAAARQMAEFLARLHRIDVAAPDLNFLQEPEGGPGYLEIERDILPEAFRAAHDRLASAWPPKNRNGAQLLHGDLWPGNLLWRDGVLNAVVDWEDAGLGDPLTDLAIARVDMSWSFGLDAVETFTACYIERTGFDPACLPLWDLRAALRQVPHAAEYAQGWQELGRGDITEEVIRQTHAGIISRAMEKLAG